MAMTDIPKLTMKEIAKFEELGGVTWESFWTGDPDRITAKAKAAMAFVVKRRQMLEDDLPLAEWTWNAAMGLTPNEANAIIFGDLDEDEAEAASSDELDDDEEGQGAAAGPLDETPSSS